MPVEVLTLIGSLGVAMITGITAVAVAAINKPRRAATPNTPPPAVPGIPVVAERDLEDEYREQRDYWKERCEAIEAYLASKGIPHPYLPQRPAAAAPDTQE